MSTSPKMLDIHEMFYYMQILYCVSSTIEGWLSGTGCYRTRSLAMKSRTFRDFLSIPWPIAAAFLGYVSVRTLAGLAVL
eukprot:1282405-Rhodomonas_salina.1